MKKFMDYQPNQGSLMPVYLPDWVPADHEINIIGPLVEQLDLTAIERSYRGGGHPAYNPLMMVKVLFYAYRLGVHSSRRLERMLYENIPMRVLSGNQQPDHWTINHFRPRHQEALAGLFRQTVVMAMKAGLVDLKHVAADGTKLKANASKHSAMSYARMEDEEKRLAAEIDAWFKESDVVGEVEDNEMGDRRGNEVPPHLIDARKRLGAIRRAKAELEAEAKSREEAHRKELESQGRKARGSKRGGNPRARAQSNFTDPDSKIMVKGGQNGMVVRMRPPQPAEARQRRTVRVPRAGLTSLATEITEKGATHHRWLLRHGSATHTAC